MKSMAEGRRIRFLLEGKNISQLEQMKRKRPELKDIIDEIIKERLTKTTRGVKW